MLEFFFITADRFKLGHQQYENVREKKLEDFGAQNIYKTENNNTIYENKERKKEKEKFTLAFNFFHY